MFIATHPSHKMAAYVLLNDRLFFIHNSDQFTHIAPAWDHSDPFDTDDKNKAAYSQMRALFRLVTDTAELPLCIDSTLPQNHTIPEWLHALRIRNLEPTDESNTEHIIHATTPRFVANICPDNQDIDTIHPIDLIPNQRPAFAAAEKFLAGH